MKKIKFDFIPPRLRLWLPPLIGIPAMLLLSIWSDIARFFLFTHHIFWAASIFLLLNPVIETFLSGPTEKKWEPAKPQPSAKARQRAGARQRLAKQHAGPITETSAERLARLQKEKEKVDEQLEALTRKSKVRNK
jgi:hypothetical protein